MGASVRPQFQPPTGVGQPGQHPQAPQFQVPQPQAQPPIPASIVRESGGISYPPQNIPAFPQQNGQQQQFAPQQQQPGQQQGGYVPAGAQLAPQPQQQQPQGIDLGARLDGEHVPAHLRGRTVGEALAQLQVLSRVVAQQGGQQQPQAPVPQPQPTLAPAPAPGQPASPQQVQGTAEFFRNPRETVRSEAKQAAVEAIREVLGPVIQPMAQQNAQRMAVEARDQLVAQIGQQRFQQLWPTMVNYLAGQTPNDLANPATWQLAARTAAGELLLNGQQMQQPQQPQQPTWQPPYQPAQQPNPAGAYPAQMVGPSGQPIPNAAGFFTESPSGGQVNGRPALSSLQEQARQGMNMTYEQYYAWQGGVQAGAR